MQPVTHEYPTDRQIETVTAMFDFIYQYDKKKAAEAKATQDMCSNKDENSTFKTSTLKNLKSSMATETETHPKDKFFCFYTRTFKLFESDKSNEEYAIVYDGFFGEFKLTTMSDSMKAIRIEALNEEDKA